MKRFWQRWGGWTPFNRKWPGCRTKLSEATAICCTMTCLGYGVSTNILLSETLWPQGLLLLHHQLFLRQQALDGGQFGSRTRTATLYYLYKSNDSIHTLFMLTCPDSDVNTNSVHCENWNVFFLKCMFSYVFQSTPKPLRKDPSFSFFTLSHVILWNSILMPSKKWISSKPAILYERH